MTSARRIGAVSWAMANPAADAMTSDSGTPTMATSSELPRYRPNGSSVNRRSHAARVTGSGSHSVARGGGRSGERSEAATIQSSGTRKTAAMATSSSARPGDRPGGRAATASAVRSHRATPAPAATAHSPSSSAPVISATSSISADPVPYRKRSNASSWISWGRKRVA